MKFIIEVEPIKGTSLYKAKGFNTLVFDAEGLRRLTPMEEELKAGDKIKSFSSSVTYTFMGYANDGMLNCINDVTGKYICISKNDNYFKYSNFDTATYENTEENK